MPCGWASYSRNGLTVPTNLESNMLYMVEISYENGNEAFMLIKADTASRAMMIATADFSDEIVVRSIFARKIDLQHDKIIWNRTVSQ